MKFEFSFLFVLGFLLMNFMMGPFFFVYIYLTLPVTVPLLVACMWIHHQIKIFGIANGYWEPQPPPADDSPTYHVTVGFRHPVIGSDRHHLRKCIFRYKNGNPDNYIHITHWDISQIKDMSYLFHNMIQTKRDNDAFAGIEDWDMSHVEKIDDMFGGCAAFNRPIGKWKLPMVRSLNRLFYGCPAFFQSLSEWENTIGSKVLDGPIQIEGVFQDTDRFWQKHAWLENLKKQNRLQSN
jgi:hypothetical protein